MEFHCFDHTNKFPSSWHIDLLCHMLYIENLLVKNAKTRLLLVVAFVVSE